MSGPFFDWRCLCDEVFRCADSAFMQEILTQRTQIGTEGSMGRLDAAVLFGLVKICRPVVVVETGSHTGMSSTFILHAMREAKVKGGRLHSIDRRQDALVAALVPDDLRGGLVQHCGEVRELLAAGALPAEIDFFLHDSTHRYHYQRWEFEAFWPLLRSGGMLVSHDVNLNASFVDFVSRTYVHDDGGMTAPALTGHRTWGRLAGLGFILKA